MPAGLLKIAACPYVLFHDTALTISGCWWLRYLWYRLYQQCYVKENVFCYHQHAKNSVYIPTSGEDNVVVVAMAQPGERSRDLSQLGWFLHLACSPHSAGSFHRRHILGCISRSIHRFYRRSHSNVTGMTVTMIFWIIRVRKVSPSLILSLITFSKKNIFLNYYSNLKKIISDGKIFVTNNPNLSLLKTLIYRLY